MSTPFRAAEKKFKDRSLPSDLSTVLDLACADPQRAYEVARGRWAGRFDALICKPVGHHALAVESLPGLVILPSFLSHQHQRQLVRWALDHAKHPNDTNLDIHYLVPPEGIWNAHLRSGTQLIAPKYPGAAPHSQQSGPRQLTNNTPASTETISLINSTPKPPPPPSPTARPILPFALLYKLRWANIGWFYHWGVKQYDFTKGKGHIDSILRDLCQNAVASVDWDALYTGSEAQWPQKRPEWRFWRETYEPDAGIVNFYQEKDTLMAHVDRSESLESISTYHDPRLGCAAVFLVGSQTRDTEPVPILLRSGDVLIMSGPNCRRVYHGVPRILEGTLPPHFMSELLPTSERESWVPYEQYMRTTRINVNARQVFPKDFDPGEAQEIG